MIVLGGSVSISQVPLPPGEGGPEGRVRVMKRRISSANNSGAFITMPFGTRSI